MSISVLIVNGLPHCEQFLHHFPHGEVDQSNCIGQTNKCKKLHPKGTKHCQYLQFMIETQCSLIVDLPCTDDSPSISSLDFLTKSVNREAICSRSKTSSNLPSRMSMAASTSNFCGYHYFLLEVQSESK